MWCYVNEFYYFVKLLKFLFIFYFFRQEYLDTLIAPIVRGIYDQPLNVTSFAGEVSMLGVLAPPISAAQGNSQLPKVRKFFVQYFHS